MCIATGSGGSVSPALIDRAESVFHSAAAEVMSSTAEDLVPLWSCGTKHAFAGRDRYLIWGPESDEPEVVFENLRRSSCESSSPISGRTKRMAANARVSRTCCYLRTKRPRHLSPSNAEGRGFRPIRRRPSARCRTLPATSS